MDRQATFVNTAKSLFYHSNGTGRDGYITRKDFEIC